MGESKSQLSTNYLVATGDELGNIRLRSLFESSPDRLLRSGESPILALAFSPDGTVLAALSENQALTLWRTTTGAIAQSSELDDPIHGPISFRPTGTPLLASLDLGEDYIVQFLPDGSQFSRIARNQMPYVYALSQPYPPFQFWTNGDLVTWSGTKDGHLQFVNVTDNVLMTLPHDFPTDDGFPEAFGTSGSGTSFAIGASEGPIQVWDLETQRITATLEGHDRQGADGWLGSIRHVAFGNHADILVSIGWDDTTRLWDIARGQQLRLIESCCYADFTADGTLLVTADNRSGLVRVWGLSPYAP